MSGHEISPNKIAKPSYSVKSDSMNLLFESISPKTENYGKTIRTINDEVHFEWYNLSKDKQKFGLIFNDSIAQKKNKRTISDAIYDTIIFNLSGVTVKKDNKWGILQQTEGKLTSIITYDTLIPMRNDGFCVKQNNKWGALNGNGSLAVEIKYDSILSNFDDSNWFFSNVFVQYEGKWGIVERKKNTRNKSKIKNKTLLPFKYDSFKPVKGLWNYVIVEKDRKYGVLRKIMDYTVLLKIKYNDIDGTFYHPIWTSVFYKIKNEKGDWVYISEKGTKHWE